MFDKAIITYCVCDEVCKANRMKDDPQCKMSTAEVMTFAILSALLFSGNYRHAALITRHCRLFPKVLSLSQLVRRIHRIPDEVWMQVFIALIPILVNNFINGHEVLVQILAIISMLILLNINEKGLIKRCPANRVYL